MRPRPSLRSAAAAGALSLATTGAAESVPSAAHAQANGIHPYAQIARVGVDKRRLDVRAGRRVVVIGAVAPVTAGVRARLQLRRGHRWRTLDADRTNGRGRYVLRARLRRPMSGRGRVLVAGLHRPLGRVNAYRWAHASWYGPGLYGNRLGCGGTLTTSRLGVANKSLPCGTKVTLRHRGRKIRVAVIDRGPYVAGREYDLTAATARRLRFHGHGAIQATR